MGRSLSLVRLGFMRAGEVILRTRSSVMNPLMG